MTDPASFIRAHLPIVPVPFVPELRLHRAHPSSGLRRLADANNGAFGSPYWAYPWSGGLALARYVLDHPESVAGRRVLDLGAGSGLVAIAAAKAGACDVVAAETDRIALTALGLNAAANDVPITIVPDDLTAGTPPPVDLVLVGDLFYERATAERVTAFLDRCLVAGCAVLIGDPGRAYLPVARLRQIADYEVAEVGGSPDRPTLKSIVFAFEAKMATCL